MGIFGFCDKSVEIPLKILLNIGKKVYWKEQFWRGTEMSRQF